MKKLILLSSFTIFVTGCSSISNDQYLSMYENNCIPYLNSVIDKKVGDDTSAETRLKWENVIFQDYKIAVDTNNSKEVRTKAIKQASITCDVQKQLGI